ncbi:hypothetical protein GLOIN_2v1773329 [Rhizophagus irregularis DAOM 181602=DAOM 197198]|uniref:NADP-dependent oxidoreductase domain-containing protein n=1 Tax=Rhizophagus irregularis (strain DAOM 181602 / DAOM 197198 / MUCL 43194) TaxID=747089 RepID=A0A2P4Q4W1_RHIID|nr:hypothetical protein GLOIN_2v1773329 [Rhizophagus irregularis DAOM 181602=DAOM 197198]POG72689.1 hypothetical protein GLOIN_2v1773329 [Rhizophagus irregularis DAOM 181602=DAOM 197198]|eukprot:XP_025179555.1 hypothetical protein GLOIN_2v1773329 [Rhizophagus irregularis DAOM 181602=DAOM 197198]
MNLVKVMALLLTADIKTLNQDIYENGTNEILLSKVRNEVFIISFSKFGIANSEFKAELVKEGKIKYIGLSECSAETLRRAYKVHPIVEVQFLGLFDIEINGIIEAYPN